MFRNIIWGTYLFFAMICLIMAIVIHLYYPETRGRSLEEIQLIFSGALIDQRPDAHHPSTAAEALLHLEQIQHKDKRDQMARNKEYPFSFPEIMEVSSPRNVTRVFNNRASNDSPRSEIMSSHPQGSFSVNSCRKPPSSSSIELSVKSLYSGRYEDSQA